MARFLLGAIAFCLLAISANARVQGQVQGQGQDFEIHGHVYCDPCRFQFKTNLSYPLDAMQLKIECKNRDNKTTTFTSETKSRPDGYFVVKVPGDHEEDICQVILTPNKHPQCNEIMATRDRDQVSLADNAGVVGNVRYTNDLFYMTKDVDKRCEAIYESLWDDVSEQDY